MLNRCQGGMQRLCEEGLKRLGSVKSVTQIRTATKRTSGSKTNKNDSAGRRLGPKAYEGHFVNPGQIIMRQRGTVIHPGENVGIGKDHTIFALEPGYVRFYYNPFHPLRKYVGVALKKSLTLPTPHFAPRVRRFGYEEILDSYEAEKEESRMSRKEYLQRPKLEKARQESEYQDEQTINKLVETFKEKFDLGLSESELSTVSHRFLKISKLFSVGSSVEEAADQVTSDHILSLRLQHTNGSLSKENMEKQIDAYLKLINKFDSNVSVDANGNPCDKLSSSEKQNRYNEVLKTLKEKYSNRVLSDEEKTTVYSLINNPVLFTKEEQATLLDNYLPPVLPISVKDSIVENIDLENVPNDITIIKLFDENTGSIKTVGRKKQAYSDLSKIGALSH